MSQDIEITIPRTDSLAKKAAEERVTMVMDQVREAHSPEPAAAFLAAIERFDSLSAVMRAKLYYRLQLEWESLGCKDEFYAWVERKTGKDRLYVERRVRIGAMLEDTDLPAIYRNKLHAEPMDKLQVIAGVWDSGELRPNKEGWEKLLKQPDASALGGEVRKQLGKEPRNNCVTIYMNEDGTLEAWCGDQVEPIGFIKPPTDEKSLHYRAFTRIVKGAHIQRR